MKITKIKTFYIAEEGDEKIEIEYFESGHIERRISRSRPESTLYDRAIEQIIDKKCKKR